MSYIGNTLPANFQSLPAVQRFNGDGSDTTFTLAAQIANDQSILVSVDGVTQDSNAYSVSGTTLTFTSAPSAGTGNIFVNTISPVGSTITHPASDPLSASTGTFSGKITADAGIDIDNFNIDGTTIALSSGDMTLDAAGDIILDADGADVILKDGGTTFLEIDKDGNNARIKNPIADGDIKFQGIDSSSVVTALSLDMSAAGEATFNSSVSATGTVEAKTSSGVSVVSATASGSCNLVLGTNFSGGTSQGMPNQSGFINMRQSFPIVFGTAEAERMRIGSLGHIYASSSDTSLSSLTLRKGVSGADSIDYIQARNDNNDAKFIVEGDGDVKNTNNSYGAVSDQKLKENIVDATNKLEDLKQVQVRNYNLIGSDKKHIGVVAQELETIFPALISESIDRNEDGEDLGTTTKSVKYSVFVPMLIKAMQEQQATIEALEARITALET